MINLNTNYEDIKKQLEQLENVIYRTSNPISLVAYAQTYNALSFFYYISTGEKLSNKRVKHNKMFNIQAQQKINEINNKYNKNFLENKKFHIEMLSSFYFEALDLIDEFYESNYYQLLLSTYKRPINCKNDEDLDILFRFFEEVDPSMKELFLDLKECGRFYKLNPKLNDMTGITVFNSVSNICNVFIHEKMSSLAYLATFVHELGHVKDFFDYGERFSLQEQKLYISESIYIETLSTYYQQRFYDFLFDNNIRREEVILDTIQYFYNYVGMIGDGILFSLLPDQFHQQAILGNLTRDSLADIIDNYSLAMNSLGEDVPVFDDCMEYSYGFMIANNIMDDQKKYNDFLNIRNGFFDKNKLVGIGITPEETHKKLIKNIKKFTQN